MMWRKQKLAPEELAERNARAVVGRQLSRETDRREFCVEQAVQACQDSPLQVIWLAKQIYEWIYGAKE